jgi:hypothetical protein
MTSMLVYTNNNSMMAIAHNDVMVVVNDYKVIDNKVEILPVQKQIKFKVNWKQLIRNRVYKNHKLATNLFSLNTNS